MVPDESPVFLFSQNRKQASSKCSLEEQLQEETRLLEEKREQLKKSKEREKLLEQELEIFRQEEKKKEKMVRRIWEASGLRIQGQT